MRIKYSFGLFARPHHRKDPFVRRKWMAQEGGKNEDKILDCEQCRMHSFCCSMDGVPKILDLHEDEATVFFHKMVHARKT